MSPSLNTDLIGMPGGARQLDTPALVLDLPAFRRNLERMRAHLVGSAVRLRPHAKTHKCAEVARAQMAAGAQGICTAKLAEAEVLAAAGIDDILITSPIVGVRPIRRLVLLNRRLSHLAIVADDAEAIAALDAAAQGAGQRLNVLLDLDVGTHRTGATARDALERARQIHDAPNLVFGGVQAYGGHLQHIKAHSLRAERIAAQWQGVETFVRRLRDAGIACPVVTGGGTGTYADDVSSGVLTELQAGSYIFMDRDYGSIEGVPGAPLPFEPALFVYTRVVSRQQKSFVTTDGGVKTFATDGPLPSVHAGAQGGAGYFLQGDEHGGVVLDAAALARPKAAGLDPDEAMLAHLDRIAAAQEAPDVPDHGRAIPLGHLVICTVPHCDPTVNLFDHIHCIEGDRLTQIWPIIARGCSQ